MTSEQGQYTRRQFSQLLAACAATSVFGRRTQVATQHEHPGFAYIASAANGGSIHAFQVSNPRWQPLQSIPAASPTHLEQHPTRPILYAVHNVALWNNLPRGAVSAYRIDADTGHLTLLNTQPLSLSATSPRHAAISPNGLSLLVAAEGGGICNLLPIAPDGTLQPPAAIRKEFGLIDSRSPKTSTPRQILFHPDGDSVLTADPGQESISAFAIGANSITLKHRTRIHPGAGPSHLALSPSGRTAYALHATEGSIAVCSIEPAHLSATQIFTAQHSSPALMAMHPSGRFLVTASAGKLTILSIKPSNGYLSRYGSVPHREPPAFLAFDPPGAHLLTASTSQILQMPFESASGAIIAPRAVARVEAATGILFRPA
jgi:6-phosphogluconolactonase (cycloisomerase 2 family)